ncbi:DUF2752 domain-containing protein [uncultured Ruminococcus sp.]|uniref:DUF2752 domain-containing protein n=1 Tax=uncultured Ruminococcus sp. TaxID=165186 RepID=UPI002611E0C1|nr:DUF2752 domain-containing protein [uncultured Ruminococcus sp.]
MKRRTAIGISLAVPICIFAAILCRNKIAALAESAGFPDCTFHQLTGYLCPACGNTRAVLELLHGHILRSLGYNPMILTLAAALALLYAETVCLALGKPIRLLPRSNALLFTVVGIVLGYDIIRNFFPWMTLCL